MTAEALQTIRYLCIYPLLAVASAGWAFLSWLQWHRLRTPQVFWSMHLGIALAGWAVLAIVSLWIAEDQGKGQLSGMVFTLGAGLTTIVMTIAVIMILIRTWRRNDRR